MAQKKKILCQVPKRRLNDGPDEKLLIRRLVPDACLWLGPLWLDLRFSLALTMSSLHSMFMIRVFLCELNNICVFTKTDL